MIYIPCLGSIFPECLALFPPKKTFLRSKFRQLALVPKSSGEWRLITHLSYPENDSVNDFIDPQICSVKYLSFDKVVDMVSGLGKSALCGKMDISQAFRLLVVHPGDFDLLAIYFDEHYYIDKCMPMGCSLSCAIFEKLATFLQTGQV